MLKRAAIVFGLLFLILIWKAIPPEAIGKVFPAFAPKDTYNPYLTMTAPFSEHTKAAQDALPEQQDISEIVEKIPDPTKVIPVHQPHGGAKEISDWLTNAISDVLNYPRFTEDLYDEKVMYFTAAGARAYRDFLEENKIIQSLSQSPYQVSAIVEEEPLLMNKGEVGGFYKWSYRVPILISYVPRDEKNYDKINPVNLEGTLRVQLTRIRNIPNNPYAVQIEIFKGPLRQRKD